MKVSDLPANPADVIMQIMRMWRDQGVRIVDDDELERQIAPLRDYCNEIVDENGVQIARKGDTKDG